MSAALLPDMVEVAPGSVILHDRRTSTRWEVEVTAHLLGRTPVTQGQYRAVLGATPSAAAGDDLPVETVSWLDAVRFCNALSMREHLEPAYTIDDEVTFAVGSAGYRIPTEAEWEHACRAGTTGPRYGELDEIAWYEGNSGERPHPVGTRAPNAWGLHDMLGNVWEWCFERYDPDVYGDYRVLRGGGWSDPEWSVRAGVRRRSHPTFAIEDVGFRLARSLP
jgi:sulfatase modifying factor 1